MTSRYVRFVVPCVVAAFAVNATAGAEELGRRGRMGIFLGQLTDEVKERLGLPSTEGVLINGTQPDTPAAKAGAQANDVVIKIGDESCKDVPDLIRLMRNYYAGDAVKLTVLREGKPVVLEMTLIARPKEQSDAYDIIYDSAGPEGRRVRTLITKPKEGEKFPAVLFLPSIQSATIEVGLFPQHPYKTLIEKLNEAGFVTMRAERLGVGDSEGPDVDAVRVKDDVGSFRAALAKLGTYDFVDADRIFVLSHSTGGTLAPMIAQGGKVKGVITWGAVAKPLLDYAVESIKTRWVLEVREDEEIERDLPKIATFFKLCLLEKQSPVEVFKSYPDLEALVRPIMQGDEQIMGVHYGYLQEVAALDMPKEWSKVDTNVLALWGACDYNSTKACSELIAKSVNKAHAGNATFKVLPGIDSLWQQAEDQEESFLAGFGGEFNPIIMETIKTWVKQVS